MRFLIQLWSHEDPDPRRLPDAQWIAALAEYYQALTDAGVLLAAEGLLSSASGARIALERGQRVLNEGPFHDANRLTSALLILQVRSKQEALMWAERCPLANGDLLELRELYDPPYHPREAKTCMTAWSLSDEGNAA